ncbi:ninjurin-1 [Rana temporaria]|uniref:ninjurin-1 n=1 Tax=Rana temporaria TaxID=8407 RepID=UPI001AAC77CD|nr:ninjurin-1 [Rana temporaria]
MGTHREDVAMNGIGENARLHNDEGIPERGRRDLNMNHYANKKSAAESMLDIALLMANASQLKAVIEEGPSFAYYVPLIVLISISFIFQVFVGVLLIFIVKYDLNNPARHALLDKLENAATALVFIIVIVNILITAFGVQNSAAPAKV